MEWENQEEYLQFQKVMTDEQIEELRKQIVAFIAISDQLADLHKSMSTNHHFTGIRLGNLYCDPLSGSSSCQKITARQRWTPTSLQLQILENVYEQGNGTPSKQKIKEIASQLAQHGQISETNVYNWFQNRRARSKRKLQADGEEEEEEDAGAKEKRRKPVTLDFVDHGVAQAVESFYYQNYDTGIDELIGKVESSRGYDLYSNQVEQYGLSG